MTVRLGVGAALALGAAMVAAAAGPAAAVDVGGSQATLEWAPASGPVSGYYVVVSRDAGPSQVEAVSLDTREVVAGADGETVVVQVAAFGADGVAGPLSPPSEEIRFVASGTDGGTDDGSGDGSSGDGSDPISGGDDPDSGTGGSGSAARADFDGDGTADLVLRVGDAARLWLMRGGQVASEMPLPLVPQGAQLVGAADYDGNGSADLLWEDPLRGVWTLWLLDGGAVIDAGALDASSLASDERWQVAGSGDFDGDGRDDVALFSRVAGEVEIWTLDANGVASRTRLAGHRGAWSVSAVADFDGDALAEIVWMDELGRTLEIQYPGSASPLALGAIEPTWRVVGAADGDGDGRAELVLREPSTGATQAWHLDTSGITGSLDLPTSHGELGGRGDYDADGREDLAWSDAAADAARLWLAGGETALPLGGAELLAGTGSDDGAFRARFCSGDLNGDGTITSGDYRSVLLKCYTGSTQKSCDAADLDGDGEVTQTDIEIFLLRFTGETCQDL